MVVILITTVTLILLTVLIHVEGLWYIQRGADRFNIAPPTKVGFVVLQCLCLHLLEIGLYSLAYFICDRFFDVGDMTHGQQFTVMDYLYYSAETFTALGYGDIVPTGNLRFLAAVEPLNGLTLLSWSGAFTFFIMQRYWDGKG
jgi:Ion channel